MRERGDVLGRRKEEFRGRREGRERAVIRKSAQKRKEKRLLANVGLLACPKSIFLAKHEGDGVKKI